jgi:hypothetical protein
MAPVRKLLLGNGGDAHLIRAVNRCRHADNVLEADTPLAKRPSTVRNRFSWPVGKVAGVLCGHALDDRARGTIKSTAWHGRMTQPRLPGMDIAPGCQ